jgi:hypothetical protein
MQLGIRESHSRTQGTKIRLMVPAFIEIANNKQIRLQSWVRQHKTNNWGLQISAVAQVLAQESKVIARVRVRGPLPRQLISMYREWLSPNLLCNIHSKHCLIKFGALSLHYLILDKTIFNLRFNYHNLCKAAKTARPQLITT